METQPPTDVYRTSTYQEQLRVIESDRMAYLRPDQRYRAKVTGAVAVKLSELVSLVIDMNRLSERSGKLRAMPRWIPDLHAWAFR